MGGPFQGCVRSVYWFPSGTERSAARHGGAGGAAHDELTLEELTFGRVSAFGNGGEDLGGCDAAEGDCVASNRCERDASMRRKRSVVEADDGHVVGNEPTGPLERVEVVDRDQIVVADEGRGASI